MASFLNNAYGQRLQSDKELSYEILQRMHAQKDVENTLATEAKEKGWIRRKNPFIIVTADKIFDFPEMSERDLTIFFTGSYRLSQTVSYLAEILDKYGKLTLEYVKEEPNVLEFKVHFRHISRASYRCFIRYKPNSFGVSGVIHYASECANGRRTVECCLHITAIVYYLSHARYLSKILP